MNIVPREVSAQQAGHRWLDGRFSMRSGFFAGRPPSEGDLNSRILEMFYVGIKRDVGEEEASNFVRFVNLLNDLSASAFIVAFEQFWSQSCKSPVVRQKREDRNALSGRGDVLVAEALGLIGAALGPRMSEDTITIVSASIKREFIQAHQLEIPKEERK